MHSWIPACRSQHHRFRENHLGQRLRNTRWLGRCTIAVAKGRLRMRSFKAPALVDWNIPANRKKASVFGPQARSPQMIAKGRQTMLMKWSPWLPAEGHAQPSGVIMSTQPPKPAGMPASPACRRNHRIFMAVRMPISPSDRTQKQRWSRSFRTV